MPAQSIRDLKESTEMEIRIISVGGSDDRSSNVDDRKQPRRCCQNGRGRGQERRLLPGRGWLHGTPTIGRARAGSDCSTWQAA